MASAPTTINILFADDDGVTRQTFPVTICAAATTLSHTEDFPSTLFELTEVNGRPSRASSVTRKHRRKRTSASSTSSVFSSTHSEDSVLEAKPQETLKHVIIKITTATDAEDAMRKSAVTRFDAIISDFDMGGQDGDTLFNNYRKIYDTKGLIPFIFRTSRGVEDESIKRAKTLGALHVQKNSPQDGRWPEILSEILSTIIRSKKIPASAPCAIIKGTRNSSDSPTNSKVHPHPTPPGTPGLIEVTVPAGSSPAKPVAHSPTKSSLPSTATTSPRTSNTSSTKPKRGLWARAFSCCLPCPCGKSKTPSSYTP